MADYSETVETARTYYNSSDADTFYATIWGGEDIHIGIYRDPQDSIFEASQRTVERMDGLLHVGRSSLLLDIGAGYGGAARYLAKAHQCKVDCLNLSEIQNQRNRQLNQEQGLADSINVMDGDFESIPGPDRHYDVVWSQDAILHSGNKERVFAEVARVLKPGGEFIFTDPMQADDCPTEVLKPILDRIHLDSLGSFGAYTQMAEGLGLRLVDKVDLTRHLALHYGRVLEEIRARRSEMEKAVSLDYLERMEAGLQHWINGGEKGHLAWGILHFRKSE